jgi:hypothetical protein
MQRRTVLKLGLGATIALTAAGATVALVRPGLVSGRLTPASRQVMRAVARAVLDGSLPPGEAAQSVELAAHLVRVDAAIANFPSATRAELSQLLSLLNTLPGRVALAGLHTDWPRATVPQLQACLQDMRCASITLRQQAYHALRKLTAAAYFSDASTWQAIGYPGPVAL